MGSLGTARTRSADSSMLDYGDGVSRGGRPAPGSCWGCLSLAVPSWRPSPREARAQRAPGGRPPGVLGLPSPSYARRSGTLVGEPGAGCPKTQRPGFPHHSSREPRSSRRSPIAPVRHVSRRSFMLSSQAAWRAWQCGARRPCKTTIRRAAQAHTYQTRTLRPQKNACSER